MGNTAGHRWLGLDAHEGGWRLPVTPGLVSGAAALFGGCATAAALVIARSLAPQPLVWAGVHFGALAQLGSEVDLTARVVSSGRTMTHVEVRGAVRERESFVARVAAGDRPPGLSEGSWIAPVAADVLAADPDAPDAPEVIAFDHPVHADTWAARFDWRLAGSTRDGGPPFAAWWVRPAEGEPVDPLVIAAVLVDYVTYGVGRALGVSMGGLSVDNVVRLHDPGAWSGDDWLLLEIRPEAISGGFGHGAGRLFTRDGALVATGTQSIVVNQWNWRLPSERSEAGE